MQRVKLNLPNYPDVEIEVSKSFWSGKPSVWVNGILAEKVGQQSRAFIITLSDGTSKNIEIDRGGFDYIPRVYVDGKKFELARKLEWYEILFCGIPFVLVFIGGALGALCGLIGYHSNCKVCRSNMSVLYKILSVLGINILSYGVFIILAGILSLVLHR